MSRNVAAFLVYAQRTLLLKISVSVKTAFSALFTDAELGEGLLCAQERIGNKYTVKRRNVYKILKERPSGLPN